MQTIGDQVALWAEDHLAWAPDEPLRLTDDQIRFLLAFYATTDDGRRLHRTRGVYSRPKGYGKSPLGGIVAAAEAFGPVVPDGLDSTGYAVGKPRRQSEVLMLATEEGQASNTYGPFCDLITAGGLADSLALDVGISRTRAADGTVVMPLSAGSVSKDGRRTDFATFEETHLCETPELRELIAVIRRNVAKRNGRTLELTTAWHPGGRRGYKSVAEDSWDAHIAVAEGRTPDIGLYFDHHEGPPVEDWDDDDELSAALAIAYEGCPWAPLDRLLIEVRDPTVDLSTWQRYYLNRIVMGSSNYLDPRTWDALDRGEPPAPDEPVTLGFDGSWTDDATALVVVGIESGCAHLLLLDEKPPGAAPTWEVDQHAVDAAVAKAFADYDVRLFYPDPPRWQDWVATWQDRYGDVVRPWATSRTRQIHFALERLHDAILTGSIRHTGNPALGRHLGNATKAQRQAEHYIIQKPPGVPSAKIDAAMALVLAWEARADVLAKGFRPKRSGRLVAW